MKTMRMARMVRMTKMTRIEEQAGLAASSPGLIADDYRAFSSGWIVVSGGRELSGDMRGSMLDTERSSRRSTPSREPRAGLLEPVPRPIRHI